MSKISLNLYSKPDCHLCDVAMSVIDVVAIQGLELEKVDISGDKHLMVKYGTRIPVLKDVNTGKELGWPFDERGFHDWIISLGKSAE